VTVSSLPILIVDVGGSVLMIVFSFLCLSLVSRLRRRDPQNVVWIYLFWVCMALAGFAVSRSAGHILKQALDLSGQSELWAGIRPFSGAVNTFMFVFVASATLFFDRAWNVYEQISADRTALQTAHAELLRLNQNLEAIVQARTAALAASEQEYRRIFEVSRDMILVVDGGGRIREINPAGRRMLGFAAPDQSPKGESFQVFFDHAADWHQLQAAIVKEGFVANSEVMLRRLDGSAMRSLVSASLDGDTAEPERAIHFLVRDIDQRHTMREQMAQADRLASIGQLSSGVAHELNNPLGVILGYTQLLLRNTPADSEPYRDLKTIEKHVRHCKSIVEDLLSFARRSEAKKEAGDIHRTINEVLGFIRQHSAKGRIEFKTQFAPEVPPLVMDEKKIRQVLVNLLMNAIHAVGDAGEITVATAFRPSSRQVEIRVRDTGYGIKEQDLNLIFDPFFTTKPTGEGTGLGLSVSYGIVKKHGGEIRVESAPGEGSTFAVVLPIGDKTASEVS
jgi:PAS domain S-box-containing protein